MNILSRHSTAGVVNRGAIHFKGTDVAQAYEDVVSRFLGEEVELRFTNYEKPGLLQRSFGAK